MRATRSKTLIRRVAWIMSPISCFAVFWAVFVYGASGPRIGPAASGRVLENQVVAMLRQMRKDRRNWDRRDKAVHVADVMRAQKAVDVLYPVKYAEERLLSEGTRVVEPLLSIVRNPHYEHELRMLAWVVLTEFDDPRIVREALQAADRREISPFEFRVASGGQLPYFPSSSQLKGQDVVTWMKNRLSQKSLNQLRLDMLERVIELPFADGGIYPGVPDGRVMRWLNKIYDIDIDDWLAKEAPAALEFRNRQLSKGYDPIQAFTQFRANLHEGIIDEGIKAVFRDPEDQRACRQLIEAVYDDESALHPPHTKGAEDRLRTWYRTHRGSLVYDSGKHRFVVNDKRSNPKSGVNADEGGVPMPPQNSVRAKEGHE